MYTQIYTCENCGDVDGYLDDIIIPVVNQKITNYHCTICDAFVEKKVTDTGFRCFRPLMDGDIKKELQKYPIKPV